MRDAGFVLMSPIVLAWVLGGTSSALLVDRSSDREQAKTTGIAAVQPVSGTGVHRSTTAVVHSKRDTESGRVEQSTDIVELAGDLIGRVLYHPTSVFDYRNGTLVVTGQQVFSGTVLGSAPVLLYDDTFRFEVNLKTGRESGVVHLSRNLAGPPVTCDLLVTGTGTKAPEGDAVVDYRGTCIVAK